MAVDSAWGYAGITVPAPTVGDSDWGYAGISVPSPPAAVGDSDWGYAGITVPAAGRPNLVVGGQEIDPGWYTRKAGVDLPVKRWAIVVGGVATPLAYRSPIYAPPTTGLVAGADPIGSYAAALPTSNTLYVSPTGSDAAAGTAAAPLRTVAAAVAAITATGWTIVLRAGIYHEQLEIASAKPIITLRNYPGEAAWFDGSSPFTPTWTANDDGTWTAAYGIKWDRQLGKGTLPNIWKGAAARVVVDQVFYDGVRLQPIADNTTPGAGQFSVNQAAGTITVGTNPSGHAVRISDLAYAIGRNNNVTDGLRIYGIGFRRYSPWRLEWRGAVVRLGPGSHLEQVIIQDSGQDALSLYGSASIRNVTMERCSHSGGGADARGQGILMERCLIRAINQDGYWQSEPSTAGFKTVRTLAGGGTFRENHISDVSTGVGLWFDISCNRLTLVNNWIDGTSHLGENYRSSNSLEIELSDGGLYGGIQNYHMIIGNRIVNGRLAGAFLFDAGWMKLWNNILGGSVCLYMRQDNRENNGSEGEATVGLPTATPWHTKHIASINNIMAPVGPYQLQIYAVADAAAAVHTLGGDMLDRIAGTWFAPYAITNHSLMALGNSSGSTTGYTTVASFANVAPGVGGPFTNDELGTNHEHATTPPAPTIADPMPADIAAIYGVPAGIQAVGPILPTPVPAT